MQTKKYNLGIIGGGPGGYAAAIRASQKGLSVVIFEKNCMGGVCLNRGCIPTKIILHCSSLFKTLKKADKFGVNIESYGYDYEKIFERKNELTKKIQNSLTKLVESYGAVIVSKEAKFIDEHLICAGEEIFECENIIIATGAKPVHSKEMTPDNEFIFDSDGFLNLEEIPENIFIIGSGAIGTEWARILSGFGKNVTVTEIAPNLLPCADAAVSQRLERLFKKDKIKFFTSVNAEKIEDRTVFLSNGIQLKPDIILCAAGREPVMPDFGTLKFEKSGKYLKVDENFATNYKNIYAAGDVNGILQLAHAATHQALSVVDFIVEKTPVHFEKLNVPSVVYGNPEIAWVGKTEKMLEGEDYLVSNFPVSALGKAQADDEIDGFIKILSVENKIAGAHIVSPEASSLVQQFALMIDNGLSIDEVMKTTFAHPTYSEGVFESVLNLKNLSLSLLKVK